MQFFKSENIKIFPCANRGSAEIDGNIVNFNSESRLNTEANLANLTGAVGGVDSYVIDAKEPTTDVTGYLKFIIGGYRVEISNITTNDLATIFSGNAKLGIKLREVSLDSNNKTKILDNLTTSGQDGLDEKVSDTYYFKGLCRIDNEAENTFTATLLVKSGTQFIKTQNRIKKEYIETADLTFEGIGATLSYNAKSAKKIKAGDRITFEKEGDDLKISADSGSPAAYIKSITHTGNSLTYINQNSTASTFSPTFTEKYTGTVTLVGAGDGLYISGEATKTPTINIANDRKLPTTTEWNNKSSVTGTTNGDNWVDITIDGVKKNIPQGSGGSYTAGSNIDSDKLSAGKIAVVDGPTFTNTVRILATDDPDAHLYVGDATNNTYIKKTGISTSKYEIPKGGLKYAVGATYTATGNWETPIDITAEKIIYDANKSNVTTMVNTIPTTATEGKPYMFNARTSLYFFPNINGNRYYSGASIDGVDGASFYAPTTSGTDGQILKSKGTGKAPEWADAGSSGPISAGTNISITSNQISVVDCPVFAQHVTAQKFKVTESDSGIGEQALINCSFGELYLKHKYNANSDTYLIKPFSANTTSIPENKTYTLKLPKQNATIATTDDLFYNHTIHLPATDTTKEDYVKLSIWCRKSSAFTSAQEFINYLNGKTEELEYSLVFNASGFIVKDFGKAYPIVGIYQASSWYIYYIKDDSVVSLSLNDYKGTTNFIDNLLPF